MSTPTTIAVTPERRMLNPAVVAWLGLGPAEPISRESRAANLTAIRDWLKANKLGPPLKKIFNWTEGFDEVVTILDAVDFGWVTLVTFATIKGDGTRGIQQSEYNVNSENGRGAVLIPAIRFFVGNKFSHTKLLVEREGRAVLGEYLIGCLRGFAHSVSDTALVDAIANDDLASLPLGADELRVCAILAQVATKIESPVSVGPHFENSGISAGVVQDYVVAVDIVVPFGGDVMVDGEQMLLDLLNQMAPKGKEYRLMTEDQFRDEVYRHPDNPRIDSATAAALWLSNSFSWRTRSAAQVGVLR